MSKLALRINPELNRQTAVHQAGHSSAIYPGHKRKRLLSSYFARHGFKRSGKGEPLFADRRNCGPHIQQFEIANGELTGLIITRRCLSSSGTHIPIFLYFLYFSAANINAIFTVLFLHYSSHLPRDNAMNGAGRHNFNQTLYKRQGEQWLPLWGGLIKRMNKYTW